ncbi:hypothetical protein [Streptomyces sp. NRRL F-2664]|uniref:hypothetical protein n=1 Tax=Streptomyces sp. NRRL F-2664 TaxID=1463842 RepID=UPI00131D83D2|nr:hypothetical protein [Streptomyces sp. NRRL F-2664]
MSIAVVLVLVVVAAVIAAVALGPAVASATPPDRTAARSGDEEPRGTAPTKRPPARRLSTIPPQQNREHRRSFG